MEKDLDEEKYRSRSKNANIKAVAQDILKTCKSESFEELMTRISSIDKSMSEHIKIIYPMLKGILEDPSFKHVKDLKYSSVSILKEAAITFHRAEGKVSVGLIDYLATIKCPKLYKKNIKDVDLVKNYGEGIKLYRESIKAPWPVEDRDFSLLHLTHFDSGGNVYYMRTSFQTPQIPTVKKHTRAEQHDMWILQPLSETETHIIYAGRIDPKGSVPGKIKENIAKKLQNVVDNVAEVILKEI